MRPSLLALTLLLSGALSASCARPKLEADNTLDGGIARPDAGDFWYCELGQERCYQNRHQVCVQDGEFLNYTEDDCAARGLICLDQLWCVLCDPGSIQCNEDATIVQQCAEDGSRWEVLDECDVGAGEICYDGECRNACDNAIELASNVGCEYWAVDLDNASITVGEDASAQQFGVVVSNPGDVPTTVRVEVNNAPLGEPLDLQVIDEAYVFPGDLEVFADLPRREVDGTPDGGYDYQGNTPGTHLSSRAFKITSDHPVIAYQYNPMDNAGVFSNDASLLLPTSALDGQYSVISWPQTIADTENVDTDFDDNLRTFLTIVGTTEETNVSITLSTDTIAGDNLPAYEAGDTIDLTLGPFDVVNLETGSFNADFTGTVVDADRNVAVFSGSEASDVPWFDTLSERLCCADHLEEQLVPRPTLGRAFFLTPMPRRTPAVAAAGGPVAVVQEPEFFRVLAVDPGVTTITELSLPEYAGRAITIDQGEYIDIAIATDRDSQTNLDRFAVVSEAARNFSLVSDKRISVGQFVASQQVVGIPNNLPGGDPAFIVVPPTEQFRRSYVFLTPDLYAFDFLVIVAPRGATMEFDGGPLPDSCEVAGADGSEVQVAEFLTYKCQLSFPEIEERPGNAWEILAGDQANDGVHTLRASEPVGLLLYGFDSFVSYALAGGTDLKRIQ